MSETTINFVEDLVERFPSLEHLFKEHVSDNFGEVLPHLFFGDLTRYAVDLFLQSRSRSSASSDAEKELHDLLEVLEDAYGRRAEEIDDLISDSFLENLPRPKGEHGWRIRSLIGPKMSKQLKAIG